MEAEHYPNGVLENSSTRIMNGTYKHEEILQTDESSMGRSSGAGGIKADRSWCQNCDWIVGKNHVLWAASVDEVLLHGEN